MRRTSTQRKINEGDAGKRGKHVLERKLQSEPQALHGLPDAPPHLSARAREAWNFWREQLELMQLDHAADSVALEGACVNYARAIEAELIVEREGAIINEPVFYQGKRVGVTRQKKHPAMTIANAAWSLMKAFVVEFGLTPLSRTRLTVVERRQDADDDLNELLSGPRLTAAERDRLKGH